MRGSNSRHALIANPLRKTAPSSFLGFTAEGLRMSGSEWGLTECREFAHTEDFKKKKPPVTTEGFLWAVRGSNSRHSGCKPDARTSWANCPKKKPAATYFPATKAVSSAQESLTSVFGMGTGIASPPWPPAIINLSKQRKTVRRRWCVHGIRNGMYVKRPEGGKDNMVKPHDLLVMLGWTRHRAYTCILSTR